MFLLYSFLISIYNLVLKLAALFHTKAGLIVKGRKGQIEKIKDRIHQWKGSKVIWIHSASYGEFEMARPIIESFRNKDSNIKFVFSFYSPSGYCNVDTNDKSEIKIYLDKDLYHIQKEYVNIINPYAVIFIKYEFWFNLLRVLRDMQLPYYFSSIHLNEDHYLFRKALGPFRQTLKDAKTLFCHNEDSVRILKHHGFTNLQQFGDTRINQAMINRKRKIELNWSENKPLLILGSLLTSEEAYFIDYINKEEGFNIIVAPHDPDQECIDRLIRRINKRVNCFSHLKKDKKAIQGQVLIVDTTGDLKFLYRGGLAAYVGGGFGLGPHNVIEPLIYGVRPVCGPNIRKFPMAMNLVQKDLLYLIDELDKWPEKVATILAEDSELFTKKAEGFIQQNKANLELLTREVLD